MSKRKRAACHAHLRRYFHAALPTSPIAQQAIDRRESFYFQAAVGSRVAQRLLVFFARN